MANYRLELSKGGKAGTGGSHFDYVCRQGRYRSKQKEDFIHAESGNLPEWTNGDARYYWKMNDRYERANGNAYRGFILTLPHELSNEDNIEIVREFMRETVGDKHAYTFSLHSSPSSKNGIQNVHAHVMIDFRDQSDGIVRDTPEQYFKQYNKKNPERGGCRKVDPYQRKKGTSGQQSANNLKKSRELFKELQNRQLEKTGLDIQVDHRTREAQGDDRQATIYLNVDSYKYHKRTGEENEITLKNKEIRENNKQLENIAKREKLLERQKENLLEEIRSDRERTTTDKQPEIPTKDIDREIAELEKQRNDYELTIDRKEDNSRDISRGRAGKGE